MRAARILSRLLQRDEPADVAVGLHRQSPFVLATSQGEELVLLDTRGERYYTLNEIGAHVWMMLAEPTSLAELVASIRREYDVADAASAEADVARLLRELISAGLLVAASSPQGSR